MFDVGFGTLFLCGKILVAVQFEGYLWCSRALHPLQKQGQNRIKVLLIAFKRQTLNDVLQQLEAFVVPKLHEPRNSGKQGNHATTKMSECNGFNAVGCPHCVVHRL